MYPEENRLPKQKFNATIYMNIELSLPIEAINGELATGLAQLAADELIQRAKGNAQESLKLCNYSQFKIKGVNVKPNERFT